MPSPMRPRGFAILIVLAVLAMATVILVTQLASVDGQQAAQLRNAEELKARAVAEYCLEVADAYAESVGNAFPDFDTLLDPNGIVESAGDDFLPPSGLIPSTTSIVSIPAAASGSKYRYRAFDIDTSAAGGTPGTCFIRFDDNSDDANPLLSASLTSNTGGVTEGAGADVAERDRDRTIYTTVIGVVPRRASQSTAYVEAHARVTVRRVRAMPVAASIGAAIEAGGRVDLGGSICGGTAGVIADSISGGLCSCGVVNAQLVAGSLSGAGTCGCPTCAPNTGSVVTPGPRPDPVVTVPPFGSLLANVAFGAPGSSGNNIAAATYGKGVVLIRDAEATNPASGASYVGDSYSTANTADVFVWDPEDDDAVATLGGAGVVTTVGGVVTDCRDTSTLDPLPRPCRWTPTGNVTPTGLTCRATESPCWKLVARLGTGTAPLADMDVRGAVNRGEQSSANDAAFAARTTALPNFKNAKTWATLAPGTCTTCGGAAAITMAGNNYTLNSTAKADVPAMVAAIETTTGGIITLGQGGQSTNFSRVSILAQSQVNIPASTRQCCATCDANCNLGGCNAGPPVPAANTVDHGLGFAVRTSGPCVAPSNNISIFGTLQCSQIDLDANNACLVGGLIANASPGSVACNLPGTPGTAFCDTSAAICFKNNPEVVGDIIAAGNICMKNNLKGAGTIQSQSNVGWKNNGSFFGQIKAQGNVVAKNNGTITFTGSSGTSENQGLPSSQWMDANY